MENTFCRLSNIVPINGLLYLKPKRDLTNCSFGTVSAELFKTPPYCFNFEFAFESTMPIRSPP